MWSSWMRRTLSLSRHPRDSEPGGAVAPRAQHGKEAPPTESFGANQTAPMDGARAMAAGAE
jgi:hypothetical protein